MDAAKIETLLRQLGMRNLVRRGINLMGSCPDTTAHKRGDQRPSWGINVQTPPHFHGCLGCGFKGTLRSLLVHLGQTPRQARAFTGEAEVEERDFSFERNKPKAKIPTFEDDTLYPYFPTKRSDAYFRLLRGLSLPTIRAAKLMHDIKGNRAVFPWFYEGKLVALTGRTLSPHEAKKGNKLISYLEESAKRSMLYLPQGKITAEPLIVVEGETDALKVFDAGFRNVGAQTGRLSKGQINLMLNSSATDIICFMDDDRAGENFKAVIQAELGKTKMVRTVDYRPMRENHPNQKLDPAQLTGAEIKFLVSQSRRNILGDWR